MGTEATVQLVVEILLAMGFAGGIGAAWKWLLGGRKRQRVDNAQIVNRMAVEAVQVLLEPVTKQAQDLRRQLDAARAQLDQIEAHMEQVVGYAIVMHELWGGKPGEPTVPDMVLAGGTPA